MKQTPEGSSRSETPNVLCVGDMAADIFASPMPRLPDPGELLLADRIAFFPGGNAVNTAVALQRLGERTSFVGVLGDDAFGDLLLFELQKIGLDVRGVERAVGATPATLVYRCESEDRRFIHALGVAGDFTGERVPPGLVPENGIVLAAGYLKLRSWSESSLIRLFDLARNRGSRTVLNVCVPREGDVDPGRCLRVLPYVDVFVPNEDEARVLTGRSDPAEQARVLRGAGARLVVITRGAAGLYAESADCRVVMGAFKVPLVDPSGCGDCFNAGLIAGLSRDWDLPVVLRLASAVGALGATALGCTSGVPLLSEVEQFVRSNGVHCQVIEKRSDESSG